NRISVYEEMEHIALSNATRALMGHRLPPSLYEPFFAWHREIAGMILGIPGLERLPGTRRWRGLRAKDAMWCLVREIVAAHRGDHGDDALAALIKACDSGRSGIDEDEVIVHAFTLFAAGHATLAALMTFALASVLARPDLLARLLDEQEDVIGGGVP